MARLVTTKFKVHNAEQFIESLGETSATNLYLFIGKVQEWEDEDAPPAPNEAVANTLYSYWDQIIAAKKVTSADVKHIITRYNWESNTAYTAYAHTNPDQLANNFYVVTEDFNVYKCLDNSYDLYYIFGLLYIIVYIVIVNVVSTCFSYFNRSSTHRV